MKTKDILNLKINNYDFYEALTIKGYLEKLLTTLWCEGESFSGKRPFGNSGWEYDLYKPLIEAGIVRGKFDIDGYIEEIDNKKADGIIFDCIEYCFI